MSTRNIVEFVTLLLLFITGLITKRRTKEIVKELDGFSLIFRKGDCPGAIVGGVDESDRLESRKQHKEPFWSWMIIFLISGIAGIGIYTQVVAQEVLSADLILQGKLELQGDAWEGDLSDFSFRLADDISSAKESVIRPDKEGNLYFGSYTYYKEGTYTFKIRQMEEQAEGITYDTEVVYVTVTIAEKKGRLESDIKVKKDGRTITGISFTNTYTAPEQIPEETEKQKETKQHISMPETEVPEVDGDLVISKSEAREINSESSDEKSDIRKYAYTIKIENAGDAPLYGVYVRDYMPKDSVYASHAVHGMDEEAGAYGAIEGKEHLTLFLEELEGGESVEIEIVIRLKACLPNKCMVESQTKYEVQEDSDMIYTNDPEDPIYIYHAESSDT